MKKLILTLASIALAAGISFAQDLATATETFNNGAATNASGDKVTALGYFKTALAQAEALGEEGTEIVTKCKEIVPKLMVSIAKDQIKAGSFAEAIAQLGDAAAVAESYGDADAAKDATALIPVAYIQQGNQSVKTKDFAGAAEAYKAALALEPANGNAAVRLGSALSALGDSEGAIAAFETAAANGQETVANKQISNIYLKNAAASLKAKDFQSAITAAEKSLSYGESANAYKIAGTAYNSLGKKEQAIKNLSQYLKLSPTAADAAQIKAAIEALSK